MAGREKEGEMAWRTTIDVQGDGGQSSHVRKESREEEKEEREREREVG